MKLITFTVCFILQLSICWNKERYNPINDFLLHEAGGPVTPFNKDSNAQFPTLRPPSPAPTQSTHSSSAPLHKTSPQNNKRDYVASQFPTLKPITSTSMGYNKPQTNQTPQPSSKRDYVAPQYPTLKPSSSPTTKQTNIGTTQKMSTPPKRDYVAPSFTTPKPMENKNDQSGKVKDLINFYDGKGKQDGPTLPKVPSYSSILKNPSATPQTITVKPTQGSFTNTPTKPGSWSSIVSGSKNTMPQPASPTNKPKPTVSTSTANKPNVLPSAILNNNNNNKQGSTTISDAELQVVSEELLKKDVNNAAKYVTINYQEKTTSQEKQDKASSPLLTISPEAWNIPTIQKFVPLLDNYERDTLVNEYVTAQERNEENAFMDAIMSTSVIRYLMNFLKEKGQVSQDPRQQRDFLKQLWFGLYSRGMGKISSSGFEHVFVSELKNDQILGLHNWIYFSKEEAANRANYLGYLKYINLGDKGTIMKIHFDQQGVIKPVGAMFIGTSPELEIALYTLCYVTRVENDCKLKLANNDVNIVTYKFRYRSKNYIGSAYPQI
ncbi:poly(U)-specific endoribonuclease homolog [Zerene cesonia]|uniref:poly(U)-specific endoribonuclease homolog n=1 Tax=Zerene cesonia TaxID=33412 RepID=UPI0018E4F22B|nr:poly(U)-specific endoribonuclease homolog [Zerene cesonia]